MLSGPGINFKPIQEHGDLRLQVYHAMTRLDDTRSQLRQLLETCRQQNVNVSDMLRGHGYLKSAILRIVMQHVEGITPAMIKKALDAEGITYKPQSMYLALLRMHRDQEVQRVAHGVYRPV